MMVGVVRFLGSNCDRDTLHAVDRVMRSRGLRGRMLWYADHELGDVDAVILPGGFSYGDYLRAGALAARAPIMAAVKRFAERGGPVLGICNGFQILLEAGLLEGALLSNQNLAFMCRDVHCVVEGRATPFTSAIARGRVLRLSIAHHHGLYVHPDPAGLGARGMVVMRYATDSGEILASACANGSTDNIAGVCNAAGNVVGLMPHPERALEHVLGQGGEDGRLVFESLVRHLGGARPAERAAQ